ncbi:CCC motif membrane protein [Mariniflexile sp. AS56]|uniref:CCC motif membrane protein n=1 Tax=Mariniflexile sp. AS56 TaxID=3063957 RepID=UPI0026E9AF39|nr:CCC motif membrane protein [Mariniflexile sp. AS56]MDO7173645.1 CCC motif membrane protein [Mariniflexile sp. AS56]
MNKNLNTTLIYILSILGLLCCCLGGFGIVFAGPAYYISHKKIQEAELNPDDFEGDKNAMNTAKIVALVVTIICAITLLINVYDLSTGGFEKRKDIIEQFMEGYQKGLQGN